jgi:hypothetical protein
VRGSLEGPAHRATPIAIVAIASAALLSACGGSGGVDRGGFTAEDRKAARVVLGLLSQTSVYTSAAEISYTEGFPPTACAVHIVKRTPLTFKVFMSWIPPRGINRTYSWLQAVVGPEGLKQDYAFHLGSETTEAALRAHYGDAFSKPVHKCLVLQTHSFALLPT